MSYFNIIAQTTENTVVTEYEPVKTRSGNYQSEAALEKEYHEKFKRILSVEKLYKYQEAEARFMREFMQERGHGHGGRHGGKP